MILNKVKLKILKRVTRFYNKLWFYTLAGRKNSEQLNDLKDKYKGKRCFILGNGPSLNKCDLSFLKNELTIASNANFLIWEKTGFIPNFLTVEDRLVAEDRKSQLNSIKNCLKIFPKDLSKFLKKDENTLFINFDRSYKSFPLFSENFSSKVYWGGTVSYLNMQLAYFLGVAEIYLIGFDHSYKVPDSIPDNKVITSMGPDVNHIHPDYFGKGFRWHDPNVERMEQAYKYAMDFFNKKNIKIKNATIGGKLEVFERIIYNDIFNQ